LDAVLVSLAIKETNLKVVSIKRNGSKDKNFQGSMGKGSKAESQWRKPREYPEVSYVSSFVSELLRLLVWEGKIKIKVKGERIK